jgi:hypothetical protein
MFGLALDVRPSRRLRRILLAALVCSCATLFLTQPSTARADALSFCEETLGEACPRDDVNELVHETCEERVGVDCSQGSLLAPVYELAYEVLVMTSGDDDGDGVYNAEDACRDQRGPAETAGCPDSDGDGVADRNDVCPSTHGGGFPTGCPDSDGDGVDDPNDDCPREPGGGDPYGCPPEPSESETDTADPPGSYDDSGEDPSEPDAPGDETMPADESSSGGTVAQQCPGEPYRVRHLFDGEDLPVPSGLPKLTSPEAAIASYFAASALLPPIAATEFRAAPVSPPNSQYIALNAGAPVAWVDLVQSRAGWSVTQFVGCASFVNAHLLPASG